MTIEGESDTPQAESCRGGDPLRVAKAVACSPPSLPEPRLQPGSEWVFVQLLFWIVPLLFLGRREQCLRIVALQQQLAAYQRQLGGNRLQLTGEDRWVWVMLRGRWSGWRSALVIVKPETVVAWHRTLDRWWQRR